MNQQAITHAVTCPSCGTKIVLFEQVEFKEICITLLSGGLGEIGCSQCGRVLRIRFRHAGLELVGDGESPSLLMYPDRQSAMAASQENIKPLQEKSA